MKRILNKFLSLLLSICIISSIFGNSIDAKTESETINGMKISVVQNDYKKCTLKGEYDNYVLYGTVDRLNGKITIKSIEKPKNSLFSIGSKEIKNVYEVKPKTINNDRLDATIINISTKESFKIQKSYDKVKAQAAVAIGVTGLLGILLDTLIVTAGVYAVGGITYCAASTMQEALERAYAKADEQERKQLPKYFEAKVYGGKLLVTTPLIKELAISHINIIIPWSSNIDGVMCISQDLALDLLISTGGIATFKGPQPNIHGNGSDGYYLHYHPNNKPNAHIWFY